MTANNNKLILSGNAAILETSKMGQVGGFGNVFYVNPSSKLGTNAITINAAGNTVTGGTYFIYADNDNGAVTSAVTLNGKIENNNFGAISGKSYQITPVQSDDFSVTSDIIWSKNVEPAIPKDPVVTPTTDPVTGKTTITPDDGATTTITVNSDNTATIKTESDAVVIAVSYSDTPIKTNNEVTGTVSEVKAAYKPAPAAAPAAQSIEAVTYQLNIVLTGSDALGGLKMPTISPAYDEAKAQTVPTGYSVAAMITATNAEITGINEKISSGGVHLTFSVPAAWVDRIGESKLKAFHIKNGQATPISITNIVPDGNNVKITIKGDGFSTYALGGYTAPPSPLLFLFRELGRHTARPLRDHRRQLCNACNRPLPWKQTGKTPAEPTKTGATFAGWYKDSAPARTHGTSRTASTAT